MSHMAPENRDEVTCRGHSGLADQDYKLLSAIAPTIAQPSEYIDFGIPWDELTRKVGQVIGMAAEADALVADVEAQFAAAREAHPEFVGATSVMATPYEGIWVYGPEDVRGRFLTALGVELPADLAEVTGAEFGGDLSDERVDLLDVDVIVWLDAESLVDQAPGTYTKLDRPPRAARGVRRQLQLDARWGHVVRVRAQPAVPLGGPDPDARRRDRWRRRDAGADRRRVIDCRGMMSGKCLDNLCSRRGA